MKNIIQLLNQNKLVVILLLVIGYLIIQNQLGGVRPLKSASLSSVGRGGVVENLAADMSFTQSIGIPSPIIPREAPPTDAQDRKVITDTSLSLLVKDVIQTMSAIQSAAENLGGYLVNSDVSVPEGPATGSITVRVPEDKRAAALEQFKALAVKTVSQNVIGFDVTDEYVDIEARLEVLNATKTKFETILKGATKIPDLLEVQRELTNLQSQIDALKGQQKYLEQSAKLSKITVYLSTDELALPYAPDKPWRPQVIFKQAVRSLVSAGRSAITALIWIIVFSPVWLPLLLVGLWLKRRLAK